MTERIVAAILATGIVAMTPAANAAPSATRSVQQGALAGTTQGAVAAFLGVPFAAAPTGSLRWRAPRPAPAWQGVRKADKFGASCIQPYPATPFGPYTAEFIDTPPVSEDCLFLNIWTPAAPGEHLPVFVWIHGGAFLGGSGAIAIYNGAKLAARGAVVVTLNYRVGPLGFLAHPGLSAESYRHTSGNYGLLDQVAALRWIRSNIAVFGGDPRNVTIAGQSAGAASVNDLVVSPAAVGLFQRAIAESGSGMGVGAPTLKQAEQDGVRFARYLGAGDVPALRALPAAQIQSAVFMPLDAGKSGPPPIRFQPLIDGVTLPEDPDSPKAVALAQVPMLTGFTADENFDAVSPTAVQLEQLLRSRYAANAESLLKLYPHATDKEAAASARMLARDRYMAALLLWAQGRVKRAGSAVFAYRFDHPVPVAKPPDFGAFHTAEVPYVFGNIDDSLRPYTDADRKVSAQVQGYWLNFMRSGDPNGPGLPAWPRTSAGTTMVMSLGPQPALRPAVSASDRFDALRAYVQGGGTLSLF